MSLPRKGAGARAGDTGKGRTLLRALRRRVPVLILPPVCPWRFLRLFATGDSHSKSWRDLILRVWHVDLLRCPVCQNPMRVLGVIDYPRVVEKILRHLGAWHDPPAYRSLGAGRPAGLSPPGAAGPYTYEPCGDVAPTPDYENVLTE